MEKDSTEMIGKGKRTGATGGRIDPFTGARPRNSRLEKARLREEGLPPMPDWRDALAEFMRDEFGPPDKERT